MPRYYINLTGTDEHVVDAEGIDLIDGRAVAQEALHAMRQILAEDVRQGTVDQSLQVEVLDSRGLLVHVVTCAMVLANQQPAPPILNTAA